MGEYALICDEGGKLYAVPVDDMLSYHYIRKLEYVLTDMAYDASTTQYTASQAVACWFP